MDQLITTQALAKLTGIPERTIGRWRAERIITPASRGRWRVEETLRAIIRHLRNAQPTGDARTRLFEASARYKEVSTGLLERTLVPQEHCTQGYAALCGLLVNGLGRLPGRLAGVLHGIESPGEIRGLVQIEVHALRAELHATLREIIAKLEAES